MCGGVYYTHKNRDIRLYFPNPRAMLPVRMKDGEVCLLPWGRRSDQPGKLPRGGGARLAAVYSGSWDRWFPAVSYTHLTLPTNTVTCRSRWSPYH